ncbi:MAG: methyltransferase domain-containing protein [Syntrophobacteraceae bacterium]|nr:methyltransferase domain-containing protein [Syntrophobacteraceae bacterium]
MGLFDDVMAVGNSFMKSRVVLTAAELDLFTLIDESPRTGEEVAGQLGLHVRALTRLLDALVTLDLLKKDKDVYRVTSVGALYSSRHPETMLPMALHMKSLWHGWTGLTDVVRRGPNPSSQPGKGMDERDRKAFIGAMHVVGRKLSAEIAESIDLGRFRCLLDIGAGSGTYTMAFLNRNPNMTAVLFDLASVIPMAKERMEAAGLAQRVKFVAGDFHDDELPGGCDLALLSAIIHQNSPEENISLYSKILKALQPGGTLLIRDHIMDESRTWPPLGAMFALNMLINTPGGDTYTWSEVEESLKQAGFIDIQRMRKGERMDCLAAAVKPA